jgi:hypothetical protein
LSMKRIGRPVVGPSRRNRRKKRPQSKCDPGCGPTLREGGLTSNAKFGSIRPLVDSDVQDAVASVKVRNEDWLDCLHN